MATQQINIVNGPSKFELMMSCFTGKEVRFQLEAPPDGSPTQSIFGMWIGIEPEDGSGESWNISFRSSRPVSNMTIKGYYSSKNRSGILTCKKD